VPSLRFRTLDLRIRTFSGDVWGGARDAAWWVATAPRAAAYASLVLHMQGLQVPNARLSTATAAYFLRVRPLQTATSSLPGGVVAMLDGVVGRRPADCRPDTSNIKQHRGFAEACRGGCRPDDGVVGTDDDACGIVCSRRDIARGRCGIGRGRCIHFWRVMLHMHLRCAALRGGWHGLAGGAAAFGMPPATGCPRPRRG
jgi:hypothetical protein